MYVHLHTLTQVGHSSLTASKDWMNDLQHISRKQYGDVFVTLNPPFEPEESSVIGRWRYDHPVLNTEVRFS